MCSLEVAMEQLQKILIGQPSLKMFYIVLKNGNIAVEQNGRKSKHYFM